MGDKLIDRNQRYRQVGDQIETILADLDLNEAVLALQEPLDFIATLALITLFQYAEGLADQQAAEAVRSRPDWKYALNLPLSDPGFDAGWLCRFREFALQSGSTQSVLQNLAVRLAKTGGFDTISDQASKSNEILEVVCRSNRIVQETEVVLLAIEALTPWEPTWPGALPLSSLYASYAKVFCMIREIRDFEEVTRLDNQIHADAAALLSAVGSLGNEDLNELPEIQKLREIWEKQKDWRGANITSKKRPTWQPVACHHCSVKAFQPSHREWMGDLR